MGVQPVEQFEFGNDFLVTGLDRFLLALAALLDAFQIGEDEFSVDDFDIAHRIDRIHDVFDVRVLEAADHLDDGVHFADVAEELVAQTFALAGAFDEAGNVDELEDGRDQFLGTADFGQDSQPVIGDRNHAVIRLNGAKTVVGGHGLTALGQRVKEGTLADIRQANNSGAKHSLTILADGLIPVLKEFAC